MQFVAGRQLYTAGALKGGEASVRKAVETVQRCRPSGGGVRSARQTHARQFPAGVLACGASEFRTESAARTGSAHHRRDYQAQAPATCGTNPVMNESISERTHGDDLFTN